MEGTSDERTLYDASDRLLEWLLELNSDQNRDLVLLSILASLEVRPTRVLLGALADSEICVENRSLMSKIASLLFHKDKRLAQMAASCLLVTCGDEGRDLVSDSLKQVPPPPHGKLVAGMVSLIS